MFSATVNSNLLYFLPTFLCVSHSIDICTAATRNVRRAHTVSTNQIEDLLNFR